jgi:hypothetical protein
MQRSFVLTLVAISVLSISAHAQKRRTPPNPETAATQPAPSYREGQVVQETVCKGLPIPDGYVTAGETFTSDCKGGAWILKRRGTRLRPDVATPTYAPPAYAPKSRARTEDDAEPAAGDSKGAAGNAVRALRRMNNATRVGVRFDEYRDELLALKEKMDDLMPHIADGPARDNISAAMSEYYYARDIWSLMIRNGFDWISAEDNGPGSELMLKYSIEPIRDRRGQRILTRQLVMGAIWRTATEHVRAAASHVGG